MNTRNSLFLGSMRAGALTLAALVGPTQAMAETTTYYSSSECDPSYGNDEYATPSYRSSSGRLYNNSYDRGMHVYCPITHTGGEFVTGTVMALDNRSDNDIDCTLKSVDEIGGYIDSARESSRGSHPTPLYIHFPEVEIDDTGSVFIRCFVPAGQAIQSYRVTVY